MLLYTAQMNFKPKPNFNGVVLNATWKQVETGQARPEEVFLAPTKAMWLELRSAREEGQIVEGWRRYIQQYQGLLQARFESNMESVARILSRPNVVIKCCC